MFVLVFRVVCVCVKITRKVCVFMCTVHTQTYTHTHIPKISFKNLTVTVVLGFKSVSTTDSTLFTLRNCVRRMHFKTV